MHFQAMAAPVLKPNCRTVVCHTHNPLRVSPVEKLFASGRVFIVVDCASEKAVYPGTNVTRFDSQLLSKSSGADTQNTIIRILIQRPKDGVVIL